jgi:hypothetical protein
MDTRLNDDTDNQPTPPDDPAEAAGSDLGQDVGAYLLDAAAPEERAEFEQAAGALPEVRAEAVELAPAAVALGTIYELSPEEAPEAFDLSVEPSAELRGRILASAWAEAVAHPPAAVIEPTPIAAPRPIRPQGRVRGGAPAPALAGARPLRRQTMLTPWMAAAAMLVVAVGLALWALALQNKMDDQSREMRAQSTEIAQIRSSANASAFALTATGDGPSQASGMLYYSPQKQQAVLVMDKLPMPSDNSVYQLWYMVNNTPMPGATFKPSADGSAMMVITPTVSSFDLVAMTKEPAGGSSAPTMPVLMVGSTKGTAG